MEKERLCFLTIGELSNLIKRKEVSPVEVTDSVLKRIDAVNPRINAYITILRDEAQAAAQETEKTILAGKYLGPLHGIPIALKDLFLTKGIRTTCGSKILADYVPDENATVVERLNEAGAILLGKLNMHEFARGSTSNNPYYGPVRNPWSRDMVPGGSSGGSSAGVAASLCPGSVGTDTGGSVRNPASLCGIVGLKPTFGRISRYGVLPLSWSFDHVGPITKNVEDTALIMNVIAGWDPKDPGSSRLPVPDYTQALVASVKGLKIGICREQLWDAADAEVRLVAEKAIAVLEKLGAHVEEILLPHLKYLATVYNCIRSPEAACYHETYLETRPDDYGDDVRNVLEMGKLIRATDYVKAQRVRRIIIQEFQAAFRKVDVIVGPTAPVTAFKIGTNTVRINGKVVDIRNVTSQLTRPFNVTGQPAISIPCGFASDGLPVGLQIAGKAFAEETVLRVAYTYEANTEWHKRKPPI